MINTAARSVRASLNFARDRTDGGQWCNGDDRLIRQTLQSVDVEIVDARSLPVAPRLDLEGFELAVHLLPNPSWSDQAWINEVYVPLCVELVVQHTGAATGTPLHAALVRRAGDQRGQAAPPARFAHIDVSRAGAGPIIDKVVGDGARHKYPRTAIFNVWRAISPAPHNTPLAICDQRTIAAEDLIAGTTVTVGGSEAGTPYLTSMPTTNQRWYYYSDLASDEAIIFKGIDLDEAAPLGCMHSAFDHPHPVPNATPRSSVEVRIVTFFQ
jgi:hypothetical protein